jgi:hypothetical protein
VRIGLSVQPQSQEQIMTCSRTIVWLVAAAVLAGCGDTAPPLGPADEIAAAKAAQAAGAGLVRTTWPSAEDPGMPFYARFAAPQVFVVDGWVVIPFYRDPACIPSDFNLLEVFDVPAAFGCPHTVDGISLWHGAPFTGAPKIIQMQGTGAVPYWFIPADAVLESMQDGVVTIGELAALPGRIVGHANYFTEALHPSPDPAGGGGHPAPMLNQNAHGTLDDDGRRFQFHVVVVQGTIRTIRLRFF